MDDPCYSLRNAHPNLTTMNPNHDIDLIPTFGTHEVNMQRNIGEHPKTTVLRDAELSYLNERTSWHQNLNTSTEKALIGQP